MTAPPALARQRPAAPPPIRTVPEHAAEGGLKADYEAMKAAFGVPWMGVVAMAHAQYRHFYRTLWTGLEPVARSAAFLQGCAAMRLATERGVQADLPVRALAGPLHEAGYGAREVAEIRSVIEAFSHGNYPYLLLATLTRHLLSGGVLAGGAGPAGTVAATASAPLVLMEPHHADAPTRAVFADIQATLDLPVLNTDYRALARWPSYFSLAWTGLRPAIRTAPHAALSQGLHDQAVAIVRSLPNPAGLTAAALREAAARDAPVAEVLGMVELFQWLLPELAVNVACFRAQVAAGRPDQSGWPSLK